MQVLLGLQSNALKFTMKGKIEIKVEIIEEMKRGVSEHFLQISVIDTGIGISKIDQNKLFKLFGFIKDQYQMNTNGIGLGLVISD
jgi:signal transduction histidine kinase